MLSITPVTLGWFLKTILLRPSKIQKLRDARISLIQQRNNKSGIYMCRSSITKNFIRPCVLILEHAKSTHMGARSQVRSNATRALLELSRNPHDGSIDTALSRVRLYGDISEFSKMSLRHKNVLCTKSKSVLITQ